MHIVLPLASTELLEHEARQPLELVLHLLSLVLEHELSHVVTPGEQVHEAGCLFHVVVKVAATVRVIVKQ